MVLKLRAALSARQDADFIIVARTDARAVEGIEAAIQRVNRYGAAGADVCFIERPQSQQELERIPHEVRYPLLVNMLTGGVTPILTVDELERFGYKIVVCPIESLLVGAAVQRLIDALLTRGRVDQPPGEMMTLRPGQAGARIGQGARATGSTPTYGPDACSEGYPSLARRAQGSCTCTRPRAGVCAC